jgi:hypothetical protein
LRQAYDYWQDQPGSYRAMLNSNKSNKNISEEGIAATPQNTALGSLSLERKRKPIDRFLFVRYIWYRFALLSMIRSQVRKRVKKSKMQDPTPVKESSPDFQLIIVFLSIYEPRMCPSITTSPWWKQNHCALDREVLGYTSTRRKTPDAGAIE